MHIWRGILCAGCFAQMEMVMIYTDANIFQGEKGFIKGSFRVSGDRIQEILPEIRMPGRKTRNRRSA